MKNVTRQLSPMEFDDSIEDIAFTMPVLLDVDEASMGSRVSRSQDGKSQESASRSQSTKSLKSTDVKKRTPAGTKAQIEHMQVMSISLHSHPRYYEFLTESRIHNTKPGVSPIKPTSASSSRGILSKK